MISVWPVLAASSTIGRIDTREGVFNPGTYNPKIDGISESKLSSIATDNN
jgi:hypothetical protein